MVYKGIVKRGVVVLDGIELPPEGTVVEVVIAPEQPPTLAERFADFIGIAHDLPPDLAAQHDHYAHGAPKR